VRTKELIHAIALEQRYREIVDHASSEAAARSELNARAVEATSKRVPDDISVEPVDDGGVLGEWVSSPFDTEGRRIIFVHAGAFVYGSPAESRELVARLARSSQTSVLALQQRLAPEHPLPAAIDDVVASFRWLVEHGIAAGEIALVGQSTGGGIALAAALALRDAGAPTPGALALMSPVVDLRAGTPTSVEDPVGAWELIDRNVAAYLGGTPLDDPRVSPVLAELTGLPSLLIQLGRADPVLEQGRALIEKARAAGVSVDASEWDGMFHGWQTYPHIHEAVRATNWLGEYLLQRIGAAYVPVAQIA
jgi:monoterpene epsilon-lactone hydrolase